MIKNIIDLQKIRYPEEYKSTYIYTYPSFNKELENLISKSGYLEKFKSKYRSGLRFLENLKRNCIMQSNLFEQLKESDGLYSMKLKGEKNIRILFDFQIVNGKEAAIIYNCFQEKRTKDYSMEIKVAQSRREEITDFL